MVGWDLLHQKSRLGAPQPNPVDWLISTASEWLVGIFRPFSALMPLRSTLLIGWEGDEVQRQKTKKWGFPSLTLWLSVQNQSCQCQCLDKVYRIFSQRVTFLLGWLEIWFSSLDDWKFGDLPAWVIGNLVFPSVLLSLYQVTTTVLSFPTLWNHIVGR